MPRFTTSAGTERLLLALLLIAELIVAAMIVGRSAASAPAPIAMPTAPERSAAPESASSTATLSDDRTVELISLGGPATATAAGAGFGRHG